MSLQAIMLIVNHNITIHFAFILNKLCLLLCLYWSFFMLNPYLTHCGLPFIDIVDIEFQVIDQTIFWSLHILHVSGWTDMDVIYNFSGALRYKKVRR